MCDCKYAEEIYYSVEDYVDEINDDGPGFNADLSDFRIIKPQGGWKFYVCLESQWW